MDINLIISKRIRNIRIEKKVSQKEIASVLNISQNVYSRLENGKINLTADRLVTIADYLEIDLKELFADIKLLRKV